MNNLNLHNGYDNDIDRLSREIKWNIKTHKENGCMISKTYKTSYRDGKSGANIRFLYDKKWNNFILEMRFVHEAMKNKWYYIPYCVEEKINWERAIMVIKNGITPDDKDIILINPTNLNFAIIEILN